MQNRFRGNRFSAQLSACFMLLFLAACGGGERPSSGYGGGAIYTVERGDTVYSIATRHGVAPDVLIAENGLRPPYTIHVGDQLRIPGPRSYVVSRGDTLSEIAQNFGVDMHTLAAANGIAKPYTIYTGQVLMLPKAGTRVASSSSSSSSNWSSGSASSSRGGGGRAASSTRPPVSGDAAAGTSKAVASKPSASQPTTTTPSGSGRPAFVWPVQGKIISTFGPKENGNYNDGVNIAAAAGTPVKAAAAGVVAYAGNELRGYGNLVLVRHEGGYMTAYGHNQKIMVTRDQKVGQGQEIATVGQTGNVSSPQLHFEIRKGKQAIDPAKVLGTR